MSEIYTDRDYIADIKERINKRIKDSDGMQKELAELMGVSPQRLSDILHKESNITLKTLYRVCECLGLYPEIVLLDRIKRKNGEEK